MTRLLSDSAYMIDWLPELWFGLVIMALGYLLLDGFDFGIGILFAWANPEDREYLLAAFGPVWKANEVWLVFFGTVLFAGFPAVYANLLSRHYLLAFVILVALVLRGLGAKLREERTDEIWVTFWNRCFVVGSTLAPIFLGMLVGSWILGTDSAWEIGPATIGLTVAALTVVLGGAYLALKTTGRRQQWALAQARRGTLGYVLLFVLTAAILFVAYPATQSVLLSVTTGVIISLTLVGAGIVWWGAHLTRPFVSLIGGAIIAVALIGLVATMLYPSIDPAAGLTIRDAIVSPLPLNLATSVAIVFVPIIGVYFAFLYSIFRGPARPSEGYNYTGRRNN